MIIKPHHLIDIIKLYGAGIELFIPDEAFHHDFYKIANLLVNNLDSKIVLTVDGDDICKPCNRYNGKMCTDSLIGVTDEFDTKDAYNKSLDKRILSKLFLDTDTVYTARELLKLFEADYTLIFDVWVEEDTALTTKRNDLFRRGIEKLLQ